MTDSNMDKDRPELDDEDMDEPLEEVSLTDEEGRSLVCSIERTFEIEGHEYLLLSTVDAPVEIFAWEPDEEDEEEVLVDIDDEEIDEIFSTARAVLAEQDLILNRSAFTLTVTGKLPEADEDEVITLEIGGDDDEGEDFQLLANFYHEEQEYAIYTPLTPLMFFARVTEDGELELLSPEEFQAVRPSLEDQVFDELE